MTVRYDLDEAVHLLRGLFSEAADIVDEFAHTDILDRVSTWLCGYERGVEPKTEQVPEGTVMSHVKEMAYLRSLMNGLSERFDEFEKTHDKWVRENEGRDNHVHKVGSDLNILAQRVENLEEVERLRAIYSLPPKKDQKAAPKVWHLP